MSLSLIRATFAKTNGTVQVRPGPLVELSRALLGRRFYFREHRRNCAFCKLVGANVLTHLLRIEVAKFDHQLVAPHYLDQVRAKKRKGIVAPSHNPLVTDMHQGAHTIEKRYNKSVRKRVQHFPAV